MYKAVNTKKYYLAVNTFPKTAKNPPYNETYLNGLNFYESDYAKTWFLVFETFRIIFGINKPEIGECNG